MRAAKTDGTQDGWAFTMKKPPSSAGALAAPPPSSSRATPSLSPFFLVLVRCICCGANICGTKYSCHRCHKVVDEACMTMVGSNMHCFVCTCRAYGQDVSSLNVECHKCHFRVHPGCTTDGICTSSAGRHRPSNPPQETAVQNRVALTWSWLRYDASRDKMWCIACQQYSQLGHSVPFVQGTSKYSTVQCSTVQDGTIQYKYSRGRDSAIQFSTVPYNT